MLIFHFSSKVEDICFLNSLRYQKCMCGWKCCNCSFWCLVKILTLPHPDPLVSDSVVRILGSRSASVAVRKCHGSGTLHFLKNKHDFSGERDLLSRFEKGGVKDSNPLTSRSKSGKLYHKTLRVHKNENFFSSDFEFCIISLLDVLKY